MTQVEIHTPFIRLDAFLKLCAAAETGGHAKVLVQGGQVLLNGEICEMRGKKLVNGDVVRVKGQSTEYAVLVK